MCPGMPTRRITRSQTSAPSSHGSVPTSAKPKSSANAKRGKKAVSPVHSAPAKQASKSKPAVQPAPKAKATKKQDVHVTSSRGDASFAPTSYQFTAPDTLKSFTFKPLSPSSTAQFLGATLAFSPLSARRYIYLSAFLSCLPSISDVSSIV